jgi:hypothetical protein
MCWRFCKWQVCTRKLVSLSDFYVDEIEKTIKVDAASGYLFGTFTFPEFRRQHLYSLGFEKLAQELLLQGKTTVYLLVSNRNSVMLKNTAAAKGHKDW